MTKRSDDLTGKVALVTGGSRGVGRATALMLAQAGVAVGITYHNRQEDAQAVVSEIEAMGVRAWAEGGDLADPETVARIFDRLDREFGGLDQEFGGLDFFVANAGIYPPVDCALADMDIAQWRRTMAVNLDGVFLTTREALRRMRDHGRVVLVTSTAAQRGEAYHGDYAATKGALQSLVKGLCVEVAPRNITVNAVAPGWIDTEMSQDSLLGDSGDAIRAAIPLGRVASADDVAGPIVFLCSQAARHITGEVLNVNGGAVLVG